MTGIYGIQNKINGNTYVGKTMMNFGDRWDNHKALLRNGKHDNKHLQNAWNKYGEKYTIEEVREIRRLYEQEQKSFLEISKTMNIPKPAVYLIATYRRWKYAV